MQIDRIDLYLVRFPLAKPYTLADCPLDHFDTVLLRMQSGPVSGWGEVFPGNEPVLTAAWSQGVFDCVQDCLLPRVRFGVDVESGEKLAEMYREIKGNRHARSLLDLAWWDLNSKLRKEPLHKILGGDSSKELEVGLTFDRYENPDDYLADIKRAVDEGFKRVTLKIRPGWDLQALGAVRGEHPTVMIQCDVEGTLDLDRHGEILYRFDDFMIALLEQPLSASEYVGHAMLQDSLRSGIALDESLTTPNQAEIALDLRSAGTFCLKPGKVGGLTEAKMIHDIAVSGEVDCYVGADLMTSIGYRFVAALASLPGVTRPTDYFRFDEHLAEDPGVPLTPVLRPAPPLPEDPEEERLEVHPDEHGNMVPHRGFRHAGPNILSGGKRRVIELWSEPGIGFEPDLEMIERRAIKKFSVGK